MKADVRSPDRWVRCLTTAFLLALTAVPSIAFAESAGEQVSDAVWNLHDQLQEVANKSVPGYIEASREGSPPDNSQQPFTLNYLNQIRQKNADLLNQANTRAQKQQQLANLDTEILSKIPANHPRRGEVSKELQKVASQMPETRKQIQIYTNDLAKSNAAIDRFRQNHDPTYVPPKTITAVPPPVTDVPAEPPPPQPPPRTNDGGNTDNGLAALKQKEAAQEAAARDLGQQRQSAINKYLDDPSAENRAEAEALRQQLDGMVDDLNGLRGQVDQLEGTSRTPLHVRSAKGIAEEHKRKRASGTNTDGTETTQGGACAGAMSGSEQHNPDGSDASNSYQDVGPGGSSSSSSSAASGRNQHPRKGMQRSAQSNVGSSENHHHSTGMHRKTQSNAGSSQNHHHAAGGMNASNQQTMSQNKHRPTTQQTMSQNKHRPTTQQTPAQHKYRQQRKRQGEADGQ
jgi:hypothetical protein